MEWKYVKTLKERNAVRSFLAEYNISLPLDLLECIERNNGGRPQKKVFDTEMSCGHVFNSLLSYNVDDKETIYNVYPKHFEGSSLFPIGSTPNGDFLCYDLRNRKYVLALHETDSIEDVIVEPSGKLFLL